VTGYALTLDGGTVHLMATDAAGQEHAVMLVQRARPYPFSDGWRPGRLYFDGEIVPIRSEMEAALLSLLESADVADDIGPALTTRIISFVESEEFLFFAERVEQAQDDTRYDVWVVWDNETFNKAVVKTKQLLGVGMREAKEVVEQGGPVARGVTAPDVVDWARRFREAGLGVTVVPEFRWRLP
jgi:ribosomal protein L7/L12